MKLNFKHTLLSSYAGYITQGEVNNLIPLLFVTFSHQFSIDVARLGTLILLNFGVQILTDLTATRFTDRFGLRACAVSALVISTVGLAGLGVFPFILSPYIGIALSVVLCAIGGGLCEVVVSPIVDALPLDNKSSHMALLHSFYSWGHALVVLLSTLYFSVAGIQNWRWLPVLWAIIPALTSVAFCKVPICPIIKDDEKKIPFRSLLKNRQFLLFTLVMLCAGASEITLAQWSSYFAETALGVSKTVGDLLGPCCFAITMGLTRVVYAKASKKPKLETALIISSILCITSYLLTALSPFPMLALSGCALCGMSVALMWPGVISMSADKFRNAGGAMFALLAFSGDVGCTVAPWITGIIAQATGRLGIGLAIMTVFPVTMLIILLFQYRRC